MKIPQSKYFYYLVIIVSISTIAFSVYYQLGGFSGLEVKAYPEVNYALAGVEFKGAFNDPEIEKRYNEAKELVLSGQINGTLSVIDYMDTDLGEKEVRFFIGIILNKKVTEIPTDYRVRKIQSRGALGVELNIHPLVRPNKEEIEGMIYAAAQENGLEIHDYFLEKHFPDDRIMIEAFVK